MKSDSYSKTVFCIDIGNTSAHCGVVQVGLEQLSVQNQKKIQTSAIGSELLELLATVAADAIVYCSVVPAQTELLKALLADFRGAVLHLNHQFCPGLKIHYPKPEEIGQDRLANAIAAQALYGVPSVVIDMGTAVTFDVVTEKGYEGGIIAPGLEVMTRYLHEQTALLPKLNSEDLMMPTEIIGKSTRAAMRAGCLVGCTGMIQALLRRVVQQLVQVEGASQPIVIGTGGNAGTLLKDSVPEIVIEPNMTLLGLAEAFRRSAFMHEC